MSEIKMNKEEFIARIRYLGWICYQMGAKLPLHDVLENYEITTERLESLIVGTKIALQNPDMTAEENHNLWMKTKAAQGYTYGPKIDVIAKEHPSMIPFNELTQTEKDKDVMDLLMVKLCSDLYDMISKE